VWSCRNVDDLLWCWRALEGLLLSASNESLVQLDDWRARTSAMFDWIGIHIYVTGKNVHQEIKDFFDGINDAPDSDLLNLVSKTRRPLGGRNSYVRALFNF
jgi:hypothetical protein